MAQLTKLITFFCFIFASISSFAAPIGNPGSSRILQKGFFIPKEIWANVRLGYEGDFVFYGPMQQHTPGNPPVDTYQQMVNSGTFTLNLLERLDLYSVFGASRLSLAWRYTDLANRIKYAQGETSHDFLWAAGLRALLYSLGNWDFGIGARYGSSHNYFQWLTVNGVSIDANQFSVRWQQWQANLGVSYHIDLFTPYIGVDYLHVRSKLTSEEIAVGDFAVTNNYFINKYPVGIYLGCTLSTGKYFFLNLEARLLSEEAVSVSGEFRF